MNNDVLKIKEWQSSPISFINDIWGLTPERDNEKFIKGQHVSWQQHDILQSIEEALKGNRPKRISIASGHGIGKTACMAWLIIWYLTCHFESQVAATAPTSQQMHDILWKECKKWIDLMPEVFKAKFDYTGSHIRINEAPEVWFARAATARKEAPEALAGLHGEYVLLVADEASGIPEEIYRTAEGSLTDKNTLTVLISNPTRLIGYFYDTHNSDKENWQTMQFSSIDSPLVDTVYNNRIRDKHGSESDEYKIRVLGQFPAADAVDDRGYVPLLTEADVKWCEDIPFVSVPYMGVDPSGEGKDKTVWVARDTHKAKIVGVERISKPRSIAAKSLTLMKHYEIPQPRTIIDNFGEGANVAHEIEIASYRSPQYEGKDVRDYVVPVNLGDKAEDPSYVNKRAECAFLLRQWLREGGELVYDERWKEVFLIRYKVAERTGKMQIMAKEDMRKMGMASPDYFDALLLTFYLGLGKEDGGMVSHYPDEMDFEPPKHRGDMVSSEPTW